MESQHMILATKHISSRVLVPAFLALVVLLVFAAGAAAEPTNATLCDAIGCHSNACPADVTLPTLAVVAQDATTVTYAMQTTTVAWAAFDGSTCLGFGKTSDVVTLTAPLGHVVTVYGVDGSPGPFGVVTGGYIIAPSAGANGAISPNGDKAVVEGGSQTFTFTADAGFHIADVKVDGVSKPGAVAAGSYTFAGVRSGHTIAATFAADAASYLITPSAGANGAISPSTPQTVAQGGSQTFAVTADAGFHIVDVKVDGVSDPAAVATGSYTFAGVLTDHTIAATFAADAVTYAITPSAGANGAISPNTPQTVAQGGSRAFTVTADAGFHIADVKVDGFSDPVAVATGSYTFANVQADHTIAATFAADAVTYAITPSAGANGAISPSTPQTVAQGGSQTFAMIPDAGYQVDTLTVDGSPVAATPAYTFADVSAGHTIAVTFKPVAPATSNLSLTLAGLRSGAVRLGKTVTARGALKPARATRVTLTLQRKVGGKWVKVTTKTAPVNATSGAFSCVCKPAKKGAYRMQATVAGTTAYAKATSAWRSFTVT
jgi:hypothetical protein